MDKRAEIRYSYWKRMDDLQEQQVRFKAEYLQKVEKLLSDFIEDVNSNNHVLTDDLESFMNEFNL